MPALLSRLLRRDPLFYAAWAALGGIALGTLGLALPLWGLLLLAAGSSIVGFRLGWAWLHVASVGVLFLGWTSVRRADPGLLDELWAHQEAVPAEVRGTIIAAPSEGGERVRVTVRVDQLTWAGGGENGNGSVFIDLWGPLPPCRLGDRIWASGMLSPLPAPRNPEERSRREGAGAAGGVIAELQVASRFRFRQEGVDWTGRAFEWAGVIREELSRMISRGLPEDVEEVALLQGMVLGVTGDISPESKDAFLRSGGMHIFSVSGLHVGIFGTVAWLLLRLFGVSRRPAIGVILFLGAGYAFVTGLQAPAVRAAIMLGVFLSGFLIRRQSRILNSVGLAALGILAVDPTQAFGVGFQLSFAVMVAIGVLEGPMRAVTHRMLAPDPFIPASLVPVWRRRVQRVAQYFADIVCLSAAAFVGSGLLLWWYFGTVTPAGLLANCALIPLSWLVMAMATLSMLLGTCGLGILSEPVNQLNLPLVSTLKQTATLFAALPGGHFEFAPLSDVLKAPDHPVPQIVVFDAGRGCGPQAIRVENGGRWKTWMIDCGDEPAYGRAVRPWLKRWAGREIDGFILTHAEKAHIGAASLLQDDFRVARTLGTGFSNRNGPDPLVGSGREVVVAGDRWAPAPDAAVEVLYPPAGLSAPSRADDQCVVVLISLGEWKVLSMADSGFFTEKWLLANRPELRADVVVMGRHGSDHCGLPEFFGAVRPQAVVATSTLFPDGEAIPDAFRHRLARSGVALFDQGRSGAVEMWREDRKLVLKGFVDGRIVRLSPGR